MGKVQWLSRHPLSPAQVRAIADLHGGAVQTDCPECGGVGSIVTYVPDGTWCGEEQEVFCPGCGGQGYVGAVVPPEIVHDPRPFDSAADLIDRIVAAEKAGDFCYLVAPAHLIAMLMSGTGADFGLFENAPEKRADGQFGLRAVWHVRRVWAYDMPPAMTVEEVWVNPDPSSDRGDALVPIATRKGE